VVSLVTADNFKLTTAGGEAVSGTVTAEGAETGLTAAGAQEELAKVFVFKPASALLPGTTYRVELGTAIKDYTGRSLPKVVTWTFTTAAAATPSPGAGGGGAAPTTPAPTAPETVEPLPDSKINEAVVAATEAVQIETNEEAAAFTASQLEDIAAAAKPLAVNLKQVTMTLPPEVLAMPEFKEADRVQFEARALTAAESQALVAKAENAALVKLVGLVYELEVKAVSGDQATTITTFVQPVRLTFPVPDEALAAAAAGNLQVYRYDPAANRWDLVGGTYNPADQTITVETGRFSKYALLITEGPTQVFPFVDLAGHWARADIETMFGLGLVKGVSATEFAPDRTITRAEFAALLARAVGIETGGVTTNRFTDVVPGKWYFEVVNAAAAAGLVSGYGEGRFGPGDPITREQMAAMVTRALAHKGQGVTLTVAEVDVKLAQFKDRDRIADWARESVAAAVAAGIVAGYPDGTFAPQANATRAEGAVMILRMYQQIQ